MLTAELKKLIKSTILSIDKSEVRKREKSNQLPITTLFYDTMSDKQKKALKKLCEKNQLRGVVVAFAGFKEKDGFVFTTEGFLATKEYFFTGAFIKKQITMPIEYRDIVDIHQCSKNDKGGSPIYCSITLKGEKEQISCVPLYGAYISIVLNDIINAIKSAKEQEKEEKEKKNKSSEAPKEEKSSGNIIDQLWEEAQALVDKESTPATNSTTPVTEKVEILPEKQEELPHKVKGKNKIRVISDGNYENDYSEIYKQLVNEINTRNITSYEISEYVSYAENYKALISNPEVDHILVLANPFHVGLKEIANQLFHAKIGKTSNIIVYLECSGMNDEEALELIEQDFTDEFEYYEVYPQKTIFVRGNKNYPDITMDTLIDILSRECSTYFRHTLPLRMPVEEAFHVRKDDKLTEIVHGTIQQGSVKEDDRIFLLDADGAPSATVYMMADMSLKEVTTAYPGMRVDIFLDGIPKEAVCKGKIAVSSTEGFKTANIFTAGIYVCTKAEGGHYTSFYDGMSFTLTINSREYSAVISEIYNSDMIDPGTFGTIKIKTEEPVVFEDKTAFVMTNGDKTIGKGVIFGND